MNNKVEANTTDLSIKKQKRNIAKNAHMGHFTTHFAKRNKGIKPVTFIALTFLILIAAGTLLLSFPISHKDGEFFPFVDSLFTATSAVCVTGLVVVDTFTEFTLFGQIVIIILIQLGGLGLMTMTTLIFILAGKRITLKERLILQEAYSQTDLQGLVKLTLKIAEYTFAIEGIGAVILTLSFLKDNSFITSLWKGIFHSVSAFCNAGFDILGNGNSFTVYYNRPEILITLMALIILGGIGFCVITDGINQKFKYRRLSIHSKIVIWATLALIFGGAILFLISEWSNPDTLGNMSIGDKILSAFFQSVTTRTAGFNTIDQNALTKGSLILTNLFMFIGASPGGTGGGIKTTTFIILLFMFFAGARGKEEIVAFKHTVRVRQALRAFSIMVYSLCFIFALSAIIYFTEKGLSSTVSYNAALYESFSAFGTVGLTRGITGSLSNLSLISTAVVMFVGRLGSLVLGLMFVGKHNQDLVKYSEYKIIIG